MHRMSRRDFLATLGAGVAASSIPTSLLSAAAAAPPTRPRRFVIREDRFGRMFPNLEPFFRDVTPRLRNALLEIGKPGGMMDANDSLISGPIALIVDPALNVDNPNNPTHTAGTTFMGQFIDHDITFDLTSRLGTPTDPLESPNERTPALDLDSVYGGGPLADPVLYEPATRSREWPTKLRIERSDFFEDLPRNPDISAIIADPRNDENLIIAGLQAAFILFHNRAVDVVAREQRAPSEGLFLEARRLTTWHYQWIVLHEVLPLFIGQARVDEILRDGRKFYRPDVAFIPVEFQGAAYRFGHSMVRPSYRANLAGDVDASGNPAPFFAMIFDPTAEGQADPIDLRGGCRARRRFIGWQTFFDFGTEPRPGGVDGTLGEDMRPNKRIDTKLSTPLFNLPLGTIASGDPPTSLAQRNLLRHITWSQPSGQSVANLMNVPALSSRDLRELRGFGLRLDESTPLWYYILKEAEIMEGGLRLGPVGGRIVGEVLIGLLQLDPESYLSARRPWRPTLPTRTGRVTGDFRMVDFLAFAGVDPAHRGQ